MKSRHKLILVALFLFPAFMLHFFSVNRSDAAIISKTVIFFAGQDDQLKVNGGIFSYPLVVTIPEILPAIKNAHIEISGISFNSPSQDQTINVDLQGGIVSSPKISTFLANARSQQFNIDYDVTSILYASPHSYTLNITGSATGGTFSILSAKLVLNYEYDSVAQSTLLKTTEFFVGQTNSKTPAGTIISRDFSISAPENGATIKSAFIEISGTFKDSGTGTVQAGLFNSGAGVGYNNTYNIDMGPSTSSSKFFIRYNALSDISLLNNDYTFHFTADKAVSSWSARLYLTYEYSELSAYPLSGYITSSTFDTGTAKGAAFNSITWNGNLNGGNVRLQFATSDCPNGKTNPPACDDSGSWTYLGNLCTDSSFYESASGIPQEIGCHIDHNNKIYFRYKATICSDPSCAIGGSNNPEIDNIVVNWAP